MANDLLRGTGPAATPVPEPETIPTFGYRPGEARIFQLRPGESLPAGWVDSPAKLPPEPEAAQDEGLEELRRHATSLGIKVDGRWSARKLKRMIAEAERVDDDEGD